MQDYRQIRLFAGVYSRAITLLLNLRATGVDRAAIGVSTWRQTARLSLDPRGQQCARSRVSPVFRSVRARRDFGSERERKRERKMFASSRNYYSTIAHCARARRKLSLDDDIPLRSTLRARTTDSSFSRT